VITETEKEAIIINTLKADKTLRIQRAKTIGIDHPTSLANIFVNNPNDIFKKAYIPSGLETIDYDLKQVNPINNQ
jgi:hypothetical protein